MYYDRTNNRDKDIKISLWLNKKADNDLINHLANVRPADNINEEMKRLMRSGIRGANIYDR